MIRDLARRSSRVRALYHGIRGFALGLPAASSPDTYMPELRRITPVKTPTHEFRLNLVLSTLAPGAMYGGGPTALALYKEVVDETHGRGRIISVEPLPAALRDVHGHRRSCDMGEDARRSLVSPSALPTGRLPVGPHDVFVATYWSTAEAVIRIRKWQQEIYGAVPSFFVYVIQDYEPGFFPHSAQSLLAGSTYERPEETVAIFNTHLLREYFHSQRLTFAREYSFEPRLPPALKSARTGVSYRQRRIVIYGRPSTPRNAFPLVVEALKLWRKTDPRAESWSCVSAGELHGDIDMGGLMLHSLGKLDVESYAQLLASSAVGISLMVSPHPSYPPLEMAHLGMLVITNRFAGKDLSAWHENIVSLADVTPEGLASEITRVCSRFEVDPEAGARGQTRRLDYTSDDAQFPFAGELARLLVRGAEGPAEGPVVRLAGL